MLKVYNFESTPIVDIINEILLYASKNGASDVHFDSHEGFMRCRVRIDGKLIDHADIPKQYTRNLITRIKIISGMNITESRLPQDGAIKMTIKDTDLDLRVSSLPTSNGEKIVLRILDYQRSLSGIETLGFSEENYHKVVQMTESPNGIILVTGATGSGKSTTVYSMLQRLNKEENNLITIEDPIEMDIDGINQIQTNTEIGLTFATALRAILRQDPNIIMVGEIRDSETAQIAIRAAITGHLVLSTLHTNDSLSTIERLMDMDVEKYLLASSLTGIISQRLARHLCDKCKKLRPTNDFEKKLFKNYLKQDVEEVYDAVGCDECHNGYSGRIAIQEVLYISQEIKDALSNNAEKGEIRDLIYNSDVITILEDGLQKVLNGNTSIEEVLKLIEIEELKLDNEQEQSNDVIFNENTSIENNSTINNFELENNTSNDDFLNSFNENNSIENTSLNSNNAESENNISNDDFLNSFNENNSIENTSLNSNNMESENNNSVNIKEENNGNDSIDITNADINSEIEEANDKLYDNVNEVEQDNIDDIYIPF